jgi:hypothetical protein
MRQQLKKYPGDTEDHRIRRGKMRAEMSSAMYDAERAAEIERAEGIWKMQLRRERFDEKERSR